jgi:hypothetical protein
MKTRTIGLLVFATTALVSAPLAAQNVPSNYSVSKPEGGHYRNSHGKDYVYPGTVVETGRSLKVQAPDGGPTTSFVIDQDSKVPDDLKVGARVAVDYGPTLDNKTYRVIDVKVLSAKKKFPKAKGPLEPQN